MKKDFIPFPILTTERLILRQLETQDVSALFGLRTNESVNKFLRRPIPATIEVVQGDIRKLNEGISAGKWIYWVINLKSDRKVIGTVCFWNLSEAESRAEIGYELAPDLQGKGLMQEAVLKVIVYGFEKMKLQTIEAWTNAENAGSIKLLEKNNFKRNRQAEIESDSESENQIIYFLRKRSYVKLFNGRYCKT